MKLFAVLIASVSLLFASTQSLAKDLIDTNIFPDWFKASIVREKSIKKKSKLKIKALGIKKKIKGKMIASEVDDGMWYFAIDIGASAPMECYAFTEFDGTSTSFYSIIENALAMFAEESKKTITGKFTFALDVDVSNRMPYLLLDTLYHLGEKENKVTGLLKGAAARTQDGLQICIHNEVGYRKTFLEAFKSFAGAFVPEQSPAFFEAIYKYTIQGISAGYHRETYTVDSDGDIAVNRDSALLIPVDASSISRRDSVDTEWSRPDGSVINAQTFVISNDAIESSLALAPKDGQWLVEGEVQGKAIKATLAHKQSLQSAYGTYLTTLGLLESKDDSAEIISWVPDVDPTTAMKVKLSKLKGKANANMQLDLGPIAMTLDVDKDAVARRMEVDQGAAKIMMDLLYKQGKPRRK